LRIPVGSGPYTITTLDPGRSITYTRDPHYWARDLPVTKGLYNFGAVHVDYYRDDSIALQAFKAGQFDLRRESDPGRWATAYDFPAAHDGRVRMERLPHHRTEPAYGFILNTRRDVFRDPALRAALEYSFDFDWVNKNLFHGQYHRVTSFFPNSDLAAPALPEGEELQILNGWHAQLPPEIFTAPVTPPETDGSEGSFRANLLKAEAMLREAGYALRDNQLFAPNGQLVTFEILLEDPVEEKVALNWIQSLQRLGIAARVHTVDSAQYQRRLSGFDYDVTTGKWINSNSPGNEQSFFWSSAAADQKGSRNYPGVKSAVVDALAAAIPNAQSREEQLAYAHALDRVLMQGHYIVPLYYAGEDHYAVWSALHHTDATPVYGTVLESWWKE
jgi:microcin C transport system substrate-binding protein